MGGACARCSDVEKAATDKKGLAPGRELDESEMSGEEGSSEIEAPSEDEEDDAEKRQDIADILQTTGQNLKRGKTMAMKEAISTAKKFGLETSKITEAEQQLDLHKRQQRREEVEREVEVFLRSEAAQDIGITEKMIKKAVEADCVVAVVQRLQERLQELLLTRSLEDEEIDRAREYLKQSCRDFVLAAASDSGRLASYVDLEKGTKTSAVISLDPALRLVTVSLEGGGGDKQVLQAPVTTLVAVIASSDPDVQNTKGFQKLGAGEQEGAAAIKWELEGRTGIWCFLEPTSIRRDRLIEAVAILTAVC